jgi:hypothetical protein
MHVPQRVRQQLGNAQEKLERAQRHAEEKRQASQRTVEHLQRNYETMDIEGQENDEQVEELRMEAGDIEIKVGFESWSPRSCILMVLRRWQSILRAVKQSSTSYSRNIGSSATRRVNFLLCLCIHHSMISRGIHGNTCEQIKHECIFGLSVPTGPSRCVGRLEFVVPY